MVRNCLRLAALEVRMTMQLGARGALSATEVYTEPVHWREEILRLGAT